MQKEPVLKSMDNFYLYEGDTYYRVFLGETKYVMDECDNLQNNHAVVRKDEFSEESKAFKTKPAAMRYLNIKNK